MDREQAAKRWEKWKNQRTYYQNHNTTEESTAPKLTIVKELIGQLDRELMASNTNEKNGKEIKLEKTFAKEIESNTCPICLELMIPPDHSPYILFPCGHSFCKQCLNNLKKYQKVKCPLCKQKFKNMARNIALQNLICIYTDNKDKLDKLDVEKIEEEEEKNKGNKGLYEKKLKELEKRIQIVRKQETDLMSELVGVNQLLDNKKESLKVFDQQIENFEKKILHLEEDLKLARQFRGKVENDVKKNLSCLRLKKI